MHDNYKQLIEKLLPEPHEREAFFTCYHEVLPRSIKIIEHRISEPSFTNYANSIGRTLTSPTFTDDNDSRYIERSDDSLALGKHWLHASGFFYIQEVAASLAVHSLDLKA